MVYIGMTEERYRALNRNMDLTLTPEEVAAGWHFCYEWDGMLIHREDMEAKACRCFEGRLAI